MQLNKKDFIDILGAAQVYQIGEENLRVRRGFVGEIGSTDRCEHREIVESALRLRVTEI